MTCQGGNPDSFALGQEALSRGAWADARAAFESALAADESPEAFEMLGLAAFWMEDADASIAAREAAFHAYRERHDHLGAARAAITLADDYFTFRDQKQVANGWLLRAKRLLAGREPAPSMAGSPVSRDTSPCWVATTRLRRDGSGPKRWPTAASLALSTSRCLDSPLKAWPW